MAAALNSDIELDYPSLMDSALRAVIRDVLSITSDLGAAPGEHHFYIEFRTGDPGVSIPDALKASYPERMTIVLQHQFKDLTVEAERFSVTLWFKGEPSNLVVPFDAVTVFADPSVQFELRYANDPMDEAAVQHDGDASNAPHNNEASDTATPSETSSAPEDDAMEDEHGGQVVSLDAFRKK
ncbi:MAG: ClpXP protease specificity-enhancing factor SspB [Pseudomonadota bacterium]